MAKPTSIGNILHVFRMIKDAISSATLQPRGLTVKSGGTRHLDLGAPVDDETGYWANPNLVSSKPPRWIVQVTTDQGGQAEARFARTTEGEPYGMSGTVGYVNNRDGSCAVAMFRVLLAVRPYENTAWSFPDGWECLLVLGFSKPLPAGTSGDALTDFNPQRRTVDYGGSSAKRTYHIDLIGIVKSTTTTPVVGNLTYDAAVTAVAEMAQAKLYDGTKTADRNALSADLESLFMTTPALGPFALAEDTALVGIDPLVYRQIEAAVNSGKRHIILYGPPGTGKTTLAEYLARELSERDDGDGSYLMLTASSSWSAQDLVGGYQPMGGGNIGFIPGALLRDFDKPVIIDELNRCPIDKVLGPLFSILSGQASVLPCRVDISDPQSRFHVIYPEPKAHMDQHEHAPKPAWRLICTLNTYDKTQLGQISYALSRRFSWIKIGAPANPDDFVLEISTHLGISVPDPIAANPVAAMWRAVNQAREIGGAPVIDFLKTLSNLDSKVPLFELPSRDAAPLFLAAFRTCILPLMDGLSPREASNLASGIAEAWNLDRESSALLHTDCAEFSA